MSEKELEKNLEELEEDIEVEEIEEEIVEESETQASDEIDKLKDAFTRLQADFQNYKRRQETERANIYKYASEGIVIKLLGIMDNFDRALDKADLEDSFVQGVVMIKSELDNILKEEGVEEIDSDGKPFDANLHHAVFVEESEDYDSETVTETFQKGYKLKDKVIRPAMVKVSK